MERFLRSSHDAPRDGGGQQGSGGRAAEPAGGQHEDIDADLEVSSISSGEQVDAEAVRAEGLDGSWIELPQVWHLARWFATRAKSVCHMVARIQATTNVQKDKEYVKSMRKLHVSTQAGSRGQQTRASKEKAVELVTAKAQGVLDALRGCAEREDAKAERALCNLAANPEPRAKALYELGLRVHDPTASEKSFRKALADLGLAKATKRPWKGRREEAKAAWHKECIVVLSPTLRSLTKQASAGAAENMLHQY